MKIFKTFCLIIATAVLCSFVILTRYNIIDFLTSSSYTILFANEISLQKQPETTIINFLALSKPPPVKANRELLPSNSTSNSSKQPEKTVSNFLNSPKRTVTELNHQGIKQTSNDSNTSNSTLEVDLRKRPPNLTFKIIVLTMNRHASLLRLLESLERADYGPDNVTLVIRIDHHKNNKQVIDLARTFNFSHGDKEVHVSNKTLGLRMSWLTAWRPSGDLDRAVIIEDDLEIAPGWYLWLKAAWEAYGNRTDLNGISLNRQTMVPKKGVGHREIVNDHKPFLYAMIGSHGFSPEPRHWVAFLDWVNSIDLDTFDVSVPGLITTDWWHALDKSTLWTQYFIYFCKEHSIYTMHINLPDKKTIVAHWGEPGVHNANIKPRRNFDLATTIPMEFPQDLVKYDWGAKVVSNT